MGWYNYKGFAISTYLYDKKEKKMNNINNGGDPTSQ